MESYETFLPFHLPSFYRHIYTNQYPRSLFPFSILLSFSFFLFFLSLLPISTPWSFFSFFALILDFFFEWPLYSSVGAKYLKRKRKKNELSNVTTMTQFAWHPHLRDTYRVCTSSAVKSCCGHVNAQPWQLYSKYQFRKCKTWSTLMVSSFILHWRTHRERNIEMSEAMVRFCVEEAQALQPFVLQHNFPTFSLLVNFIAIHFLSRLNGSDPLKDGCVPCLFVFFYYFFFV